MTKTQSPQLNHHGGNNPYCFKEIFIRILALIFLILAVAAVILIAEDVDAATQYNIEAICIYAFNTAQAGNLLSI